MNTTVRWQESYSNDLLAEQVVFNTTESSVHATLDSSDKAEDFFLKANPLVFLDFITRDTTLVFPRNSLFRRLVNAGEVGEEEKTLFFCEKII